MVPSKKKDQNKNKAKYIGEKGRKGLLCVQNSSVSSQHPDGKELRPV